MMSYRFKIALTSAILASITPLAVVAAPGAQEMYISPRGEVHLIGAEIASKHALNLFTVKVWGQKWFLTTLDNTELKAADGSVIKLEDLSNGHVLEVKGWPSKDNTGYIEAKFIRDLSLKNEKLVYPSISTAFCPAPVAVKTVPLVPKPAPVTTVTEVKPQISTEELPPQPTISSDKKEITQNLYLGMKSGEVLILQEFLQKNNWGIPDDGPVTGFFGKVTENALKKFQESQGLEVTGNTGPLTRSALNSLLAGKAASSAPVATSPISPTAKTITQDLKSGMKGEEVITLQEFLQKNSWGIPNDGPVTGFFGKVTEQAVTNFQKAKGLAAIGMVDFKTRELINSLLGK